MTTRDDIKKWLLKGLKNKCTHVIIACDTFDWEDYPVYVSKDDSVEIEIKKHDKIMEVYNLSIDIDEQLNLERCFNY